LADHIKNPARKAQWGKPQHRMARDRTIEGTPPFLLAVFHKNDRVKS